MNAELAAAGIVGSQRDVIVAIEPRQISLAVAERVYGLSEHTLLRLVAAEGFPARRINRRWVVSVAEADAWFAARPIGMAS